MSGIYIKGMQMPKNCYDCELIDIFKDCPHYDTPNEAFVSIPWLRERRHENCPLVPVPDHGDLVDKQRMAETNEQHYKVYEGEAEADYARKVVLRMLDQAPTVIQTDKGVTE